MSGKLDALRAGAEKLDLGEGRFLRLLSAREILEARREGRLLAKDGAEQALCGNAALLARALVDEKGPLYESGGAVLNALTAREIGALAKRWAAFDRAENPVPATQSEGEAYYAVSPENANLTVEEIAALSGLTFVDSKKDLAMLRDAGLGDKFLKNNDVVTFADWLDGVEI